MDDSTAYALVRLNKGFYRDNHESFSASRAHGWAGWERVIDSFANMSSRVSILDVACGNMRFERYARETAGGSRFDFTGIDSCAQLAQGRDGGVVFEQVDVIERLIGKERLAHGGFDAAVCFGFMHHVPTSRLRCALLQELVGQVRAGGCVAVSFWEFADDERLAERAIATTEAGCRELGLTLDRGDYLLGWNELEGVYRYCHSFSEGEVDAMLESVAPRARVEDRFRADGRNGMLNSYVILRRCGDS